MGRIQNSQKAPDSKPWDKGPLKKIGPLSGEAGIGGNGSIWMAYRVQAGCLLRVTPVSKSYTGRKCMGPAKPSAPSARMGEMVKCPAGEWMYSPALAHSWGKVKGHQVTVTFSGTASATD